MVDLRNLETFVWVPYSDLAVAVAELAKEIAAAKIAASGSRARASA